MTKQTSERSLSDLQASFPISCFDESEWKRAEVLLVQTYESWLCVLHVLLSLDFFANVNIYILYIYIHVKAFRFGDNNLLQLEAGQLWI